MLTVDRVRRLDPPVAPDELAHWLEGRLDDPHRQPALRDELFVVAPGSGTDPAGAPAGRRVRLDERPEVAEQFQRYLPEWRAWAEQDLRDEQFRSAYARLFSTYVRANGHPEELELVLGSGLLTWRPDAHPRSGVTCSSHPSRSFSRTTPAG